MKNQRLLWADSLKGALILLVIIGHAIQMTMGMATGNNHLWNLIYSFHMPAFMALSGWLAYRGESSSKLQYYSFAMYLSGCKRRCYQLMVPYMVWSIMQFILSGCYTSQRFNNIVLQPDSYFWFLWVLFWICVIFNITQLVASKLNVNETVQILGTCLLLFGIMVVKEIRVLGFQFLAYYFLFYTLGYCLHKYENSTLLKGLNKPYVMIALTLLWAFLAWGWTMHGLPSWMPAIPHVPSALLQYAYRGFTALVAIVVLIGAAPMLLNGTGKFNNALCSLGVVSLGLYVVHLLILEYVVKSIQTVIPSVETWICVSLAFAIALTISYLIVWLLSKNKYLARIFLGKI